MKFGGANTWRNLKYRQNVSLRSAFGDYCDPLQSLRRTAVLRKVLPRIQLHHLPPAPRRLQRRSFIVNHILYIIDLYTICIRQHPLYFHWCRGGTTFLKSLGINGGLSWSSRTHGHSDNGNSSKNGGVGRGDVYQVLSDELRISQWRQIAAAKGGGRPLAVLLRNPFTHVPSQYHHCLSSPAHKERGKLPKTLYVYYCMYAVASILHQPCIKQQLRNGVHCINLLGCSSQSAY